MRENFLPTVIEQAFILFMLPVFVMLCHIITAFKINNFIPFGIHVVGQVIVPNQSLFLRIIIQEISWSKTVLRSWFEL